MRFAMTPAQRRVMMLLNDGGHLECKPGYDITIIPVVGERQILRDITFHAIQDRGWINTALYISPKGKEALRLARGIR